MYLRETIQKIILFGIGFSIVFYAIHTSNILPSQQLDNDVKSIVPLFSALSLIFSIISGFVIQAQWQKWNNTLDATWGEVNMLRHLYIMAQNFPEKIRLKMRKDIREYLRILISKSTNDVNHTGARSKEVDDAMAVLESDVFHVLATHNQTGMGVFMLFNKEMEFREQRIQNASQFLPVMIKFLTILLPIILIIASFFITFNNVWYEYFFRLTLALLAYTVYLIIEDLDNPYRPGNWMLTFKGFKELLTEMDVDKKEK